MQKRLILLLTLVLLLNAWKVIGQQVDTSSSSSVSKLPTGFSVLFNKVVVYSQEGSIFSGLLVGVENDKLILRIGGQDKKIPQKNLAKVIIETEKNKSRYAISGMLLGAYLGNLIFYRAQNQPMAYMFDFEEGGIWLFLWEVTFAGAGGGLGFLSSSMFEKGKRVFNFPDSTEKRLAEWERFRRFILTGEHGPKKIHFSAQAGYIFTRVSSRYRTLMENAGYYISSYTYLFDEDAEEAIDFNLLRKLQLTISPTSNTEIGCAMYWLGEPSLLGESWQSGYPSGVAQSLHITGYYGIGIYKPFLKQMPKPIVWNVGLGAGVAKVNFSLKSSIHSWYPYLEDRSEHNISKTLFSGVVFTELNLYLHESMSLGFTADYVYIPSERAPEILEGGIPAQKLHLGNASVGFTLGLHF